MTDAEPGTAHGTAVGQAQPLDARTDLAISRTEMAARRTLMGWVRTALSMISFGFTVYKFLQASATVWGDMVLLREQGPRRLGLLLIALGTLGAAMGSVEYVATIHRLNVLSRSPTRLRALSFSSIAAIAVALLGVFLFVTIFANREVF